MYAGQAVEEAAVSDIFNNMKHPYTKALLSTIPKLGQSKDELETIPGTVPSSDNYPKGCRFSTRCKTYQTLDINQKNICIDVPPEFTSVSMEHYSRCHFNIQ